MITLGISAFHHDAAAALVSDGTVIAAVQEERFSRIKNDCRFPLQSIDYCLSAANVSIGEIDIIAFYDNPVLRADRISAMARQLGRRGFQLWDQGIGALLDDHKMLKSDWQRLLVRQEERIDLSSRLVFFDHHLSHAASSFLVSPFEQSAILTIDGVGEWTTTALAYGQESTITMINQINFPHSLGLLYSAFTSYLGFRVNSGEYKMMGLAPYGQPLFTDLIEEELIQIYSDGNFTINASYFDFGSKNRLFNAAFENLFGGPAREPSENITQRHKNISASIQKILEKALVTIAGNAKLRTKCSNLCLAGGVALNCVANTAIQRESGFDNIWIQPAAGDAGGSLGAALLAYHSIIKKRRTNPKDGMSGAFLGPEYLQPEIEDRLSAEGAIFEVAVSEELLIEECCSSLLKGHAVGWFQGRMEFGPRALGARSILADPRSEKIKTELNEKIKYREQFRPFAPAIPIEASTEWFAMHGPSPYMMFIATVLSFDNRNGSLKEAGRSELPAITHVDATARVQTVDRERNGLFHKLLTTFGELTGCPILLNTSFNVRGEPIVCSPEDAFRCFMGSGIETLLVGRCILRKEKQTVSVQTDYCNQFSPD
jgi:carbamoyltransferase